MAKLITAPHPAMDIKHTTNDFQWYILSEWIQMRANLPSQFVDWPLLFDLLLFFLRKNNDGRFVGFWGWSAYTSLLYLQMIEEKNTRKKGIKIKNHATKKLKYLIASSNINIWYFFDVLPLYVSFKQIDRQVQVVFLLISMAF